MIRIFADTSALIALRDNGDSNHVAATDWLKAAAPQTKLFLTNYVLMETHAFFCRAPSVAFAYAKRIREDAMFQIVRATEADERQAWAVLERARDKTYSFVDAVSFVVMARLGIEKALAFDDHFRQYGRFSVLPAP